MGRFPEHPGTIVMVDRFYGTAREVPASEVPEPERFVYLQDGVETDDPAAATERLPIVRVETIPTDGAGHLVPPESAATIRRMEFGPGRRALRSSLLVRDG